MSNQESTVLSLSVIAIAAIAPAILSGTAMRRLSGWPRGLVVPALLVGLTAMPYLWWQPQIIEANRHSPDAGGFIAIFMAFIMVVVLLSTLIGFAIGGVIVHRRRRKPASAIASTF